MPISIKIDVSKAVGEVSDIAKRQIPYVLAKSLTDTAKQGQKASQESLTDRSGFTLRNTWTSSNIRVSPASKKGANGTIQADVHTDFSRRPGATDYLALQEENYVKVAEHTYLCIPTDALRALAGGNSRIIPDSLKPTAMLNYCNQVFEHEVTKGKNKGSTKSVRHSAQGAVRGWFFFTDTRVGVGAQKRSQHIHLRSGARAIWGRKVGDSRKATIFYVMVHNTGSVRRRFFMEEVVQETVDANWRKNWDKNWRDAFAKGIRL